MHKCVKPSFTIHKFCLIVSVEALRPSQQFFSHVGTEPSLPGYYQYFLGGKFNVSSSRIQHGDSSEDRNPRPLASESDALPLGHCASLLYKSGMKGGLHCTVMLA